MSAIENALAEYVQEARAQASVLGEGTPPDPSLLIARVSALRRRNDGYRLGAGAMVAALFVVEIVVVLTQLSHPDVIKVAVSAFGVGVGMLIMIMIKLWRERDRIDLILCLAEELGPSALSAAFTALCETSFGRRRSTTSRAANPAPAPVAAESISRH